MLSTTGLTFRDDFHTFNCWRVERENSFYAHTIRHFTNTEMTIHLPRMLHGNACPLENLNTGLFAFFNSNGYFNSVTSLEGLKLRSIWICILLFNQVNKIHKTS